MCTTAYTLLYTGLGGIRLRLVQASANSPRPSYRWDAQGDPYAAPSATFLQKTICKGNVFWYSENALVLNQPRENMDTAAQGLLNRDEMESRRLLAAQDLQTGLSQSQVARKFGVSRTTASRWNRTLRDRKSVV